MYHTVKKDSTKEKIISIDWTALNYFKKGYKVERALRIEGYFSGEASRQGFYNLENNRIEEYGIHEPNLREFGGLWLHDYVKFRELNFLNRRNMRHYNFVIAEVFQENGNSLCKIDFKCKRINSKTTQYPFYKDFAGSILINLDDYAVIRITSEALIDKEKILKRPKWDFENLDKAWVIKKEVNYKKTGEHYFIHHTKYFDNYWLNEFADIYYFSFELKERELKDNDLTYSKIQFSDNNYWQGIFKKIK